MVLKRTGLDMETPAVEKIRAALISADMTTQAWSDSRISLKTPNRCNHSFYLYFFFFFFILINVMCDWFAMQLISSLHESLWLCLHAQISHQSEWIQSDFKLLFIWTLNIAIWFMCFFRSALHVFWTKLKHMCTVQVVMLGFVPIDLLNQIYWGFLVWLHHHFSYKCMKYSFLFTENLTFCCSRSICSKWHIMLSCKTHKNHWCLFPGMLNLTWHV